jgi:hypothetical protein
MQYSGMIAAALIIDVSTSVLLPAQQSEGLQRDTASRNLAHI